MEVRDAVCDGVPVILFEGVCEGVPVEVCEGVGVLVRVEVSVALLELLG